MVAHCPKNARDKGKGSFLAVHQTAASSQAQQIQRVMSGGSLDGMSTRNFTGVYGAHSSSSSSLGVFFTQTQQAVMAMPAASMPSLLNKDASEFMPRIIAGAPSSVLEPAPMPQELALPDESDRQHGRVRKFNEKHGSGCIAPDKRRH